MDRGSGRPTTVESGLRVNQILVFALMMGVLMFMGVVAYLTLNGLGARATVDANLMLGVLGVVLLSTTVMSVVMRNAIVGGIRTKADRGERFEPVALVQKFQVLTIVRAALAEGPALFGVVITLITGNWLGLAGGAIGLVLLALIFPTRSKFEGFVHDATGQMP